VASAAVNFSSHFATDRCVYQDISLALTPAAPRVVHAGVSLEFVLARCVRKHGHFMGHSMSLHTIAQGGIADPVPVCEKMHYLRTKVA